MSNAYRANFLYSLRLARVTEDAHYLLVYTPLLDTASGRPRVLRENKIAKSSFPVQPVETAQLKQSTTAVGHVFERSYSICRTKLRLHIHQEIEFDH